MEIHNDHRKNTFLRKFKNKLSGRRIIVILAILLGLAGFGFANIIYGAYLNQTGQTSLIKMFLARTSELDLSLYNKTC